MSSEYDINLTIIIPTYNRTDKLMRRVNELLPQMSNTDKILISDNATENFDAELINSFKKESRISLYRNKVNVGANANIVKCFELVNNDWVWLLSDDDYVKPDAIKIIKKNLIENKVDFVNFSSELLKTKRVDSVCDSFESYLNSIGNNFSNHLLISNNVFNMRVFRPLLKFAYWGCYVNAPHLAPVYCALENNAKILLSSETIVEWQKPVREDCWQQSSSFNLLFLPDVLSNTELRKKAIHSIMSSLSIPEFLIAQLAFHKISDPSCSDKVTSYAGRIMSIYIRYGSMQQRIRAVLLKLMLKFPRIYLFMVNIACSKLYGKPISDYLQKRNFEFYL